MTGLLLAVIDPVLAAQHLEVLAESLADERVRYLAVRRIQVQALAEIVTVLLQEPAAGVQHDILALLDGSVPGCPDDGAVAAVVLGIIIIITRFLIITITTSIIKGC